MSDEVYAPGELGPEKPKEYVVIDRKEHTAEELTNIMNNMYNTFYHLTEQSTEEQLIFKLDRVGYMNARKRAKNPIKRVVEELEDAKNMSGLSVDQRNQMNSEAIPNMAQLDIKEK